MRRESYVDVSEFVQYQVDLAICIDVTASMGPTIERTKRDALGFVDRLERAANAARKSVSDLRVKVIPFRDLEFEGSEAIWSSPWFELPRQSSDFSLFVNNLSAKGGGSEPESALEALWLAMNSSWRERGLKRRSIVVLLTDASAHPLGTHHYELEQQAFPTPKNFYELKKRWGCEGETEESVFGEENFNSRRLVLLTPDCAPWNDIGDQFERTLWVPSEAGAGLSELEWDEICKRIVQSV